MPHERASRSFEALGTQVTEQNVGIGSPEGLRPPGDYSTQWKLEERVGQHPARS